jgi:hypothetical protein
MERSSSQNPIATVDAYHFSARKILGKYAKRLSIPFIVVGWNKDDPVGEIEV